MPAVRTVSAGAPLGWLARGFADFRAHPLPSLFYGACFALMGWLIAVVFEHAAAYVSSLVTGFFLVGPFLATGLYALSRRREEAQHARDLLRGFVAASAWLFLGMDEAASLHEALRDLAVGLSGEHGIGHGSVWWLGVFGLVLAVILLVWARASLVVFALFYTSEMPSVHGFLGQIVSPDNVEFLVAYACVGGGFAILVFAISVVSVPMMLDRGTDGVVAVLTSARAFGANLPAMAVWGAAIVVVIAAGFALLFVGLVVAAPVIGHATWHAYRALVEPAAD